MAVEKRYEADVQALLAHRHDNGADFWATPDRRLLKGAPFSTLECALFLRELGVDPGDPVLQACADLFWAALQPDGRFKVYPQGGSYPCHTAHALALLCHLGHADDPRLKVSFQYFLDTQEPGGGWRCNKFSFGRGPETEYANPLPTLVALDAFRFCAGYADERALDAAVDFLLWHWTEKRPVGPCHYGIGSLFMQVEYPFRGYNLFQYVYVLSFYPRAARDARFLQAVRAMEETLVDGRVVPRRVVPKLAGLEFCRKGRPSELGTRRWGEVLHNLGRA